jgi:hypothetical protein
MNQYRIAYRTSDGRADYYFSFEEQPDGSWLAFIEHQPSYGNRNTGGPATHRLTDGSRLFVCWTEQLWTLEEAMGVAALWADKTQEYIRTGRRF